jgi:hypothetical protein
MPAGESLETIKAKKEAIAGIKAELKQLFALENQITQAEFDQIEALQKKAKELQKTLTTQQKLEKSINNQLMDFDEMDDTMASIGNQLKKNSALVEITNDNFTKVKLVTQSIADELVNGGVANAKTQKQVISANNAYKNMHSSIADINKEYALGKVSNDERVAQIKQQSEAFQDVVSKIDMTNVSSEELKTLLGDMKKESGSFAEGMKNAQIQSERLDSVFGSFSGIPAMGELNTLLKTNIRDTVAWKAAVFALGAALGKAAYDYFGAPIKAAMQQDKELKQSQIDTTAEIAKIQSDAQFIPRQIEQERLETRIQGEAEVARLQQEAAFAGARAAIQFSTQMQQGAAQFERASKTALFGKGIGSVGYGAAQLQLAGISADKIASGMEAAGAATGKMPSAEVGADMAIMAERTGTSVDNIASINEMFQRVDGASESTAMNLSEGLRNMADQAGIGLAGLMKEMAESSKDMLGYQIKSGPALAKQVAYAQSLGVSFGDIAKAGKSMVMNYKDSIKNEMQLSAMLGKNVDLSEVRAKFASGDQKGALESLKAQGLDPESMDMFQQEQLSQALGGMDLNSLQKIATKSGKETGGLAEASAKGGNQEFLSRTQAAEATLNSKSASISANAAILDAKLSNKIADSYMASDAYQKLKEQQADAAAQAALLAQAMKDAWTASEAYNKQLSDTAQLDFVSGLKETLMSGAAAVLGGIGTSLLDTLGGKAFSGIKGLFSKGGGGADAPADGGDAPSGPSMVTEAAVTAADSLVPGSGPMIAAAAENVDAAEEVIEKVETIKDKFKSFASTAKSILKEAGGIFKTFIKVIQDVGNQLITSVTSMIKQVLTSVQQLGGQLADTIGSVVGKIVDNVGKVLTKGVDVVTQIGNKLASGVMKIFNTVVKGLTDASSQLPTLLGNLGKAVGSFFSGMGSGLLTFAEMMATPTPLFGLPAGLIIVGMAMGIAKALDIAAPGIQALTPLLIGLADSIGGTFVEMLKAAGPVITSIFNGIGTVINSIGNAIATVITAISTSIAKFATMDAGALASVAWSITKLAGSVALFGGSQILGAVGSFFGKDIFEKIKNISSFATQIQVTADAVWSLANAFGALSAINTKALNDVPWSDMEEFASEGGRFVLANSGGGSFALSKETTKNIEKMATNTEAMVKLNNTMAKILKEGFFGGDSVSNLYLDGKQISQSFKRYKDNTKGGNPPEPSDIRLKHNIQLIGVSELGINIYTFEYIEKVGMEGTYQGVMAQELIGTEYESALVFDGEYYKVDYSKLDVEFIKIS